MCDLGFFPAVTALLAQTPADGQRLLFSATLDGDVDKLVRRFLTTRSTHSVDPPDLRGRHHGAPPGAGAAATTSSTSPPRSPTARAVRSCSSAPSTASTALVKQLARVGVKAGGLHGGKRQNQRTRILAEFREGSVNVLVCTDVAARGIHVDNISLVLHVDPPQDHKSYLHRGGRTARAGERGTVVTLVLPQRAPLHRAHDPQGRGIRRSGPGQRRATRASPRSPGPAGRAAGRPRVGARRPQAARRAAPRGRPRRRRASRPPPAP